MLISKRELEDVWELLIINILGSISCIICLGLFRKYNKIKYSTCNRGIQFLILYTVRKIYIVNLFLRKQALLIASDISTTFISLYIHIYIYIIFNIKQNL